MAPRRFSTACLSLVTACLVAGNGALARAAVLYDENFTGAAATTLNGQVPDVDQNGGFNQWRAHTHFTADGNMNAPASGSGAFLPFVPTPGSVYTLSASFTNVVGNTNWMAFGFAESVPANPQNTGNDYRFISGATTGKAWMLFRGAFGTGALTHQTHRGNADSGTANGADWSVGTFAPGGNIDLQIVLDTTAATYTATFYAKLPTDGGYTQVSAGALNLAAQDIGAVGFAAAAVSTSIDAVMTNFSLETNGPVIVPGDVDGNGIVNALDFNVIRDNLFNAATSRAQGDLNLDGTVNFTDFRLWKSVASAEVLAEIGAFGVPEPATCGLLALAGVGLISARRRFSSSAL
jgi:hypothetical protein